MHDNPDDLQTVSTSSAPMVTGTTTSLFGRSIRLTPAERLKGRLMRAPDGHGDGGAAGGEGGGDGAPAGGEGGSGVGDGAPLDDARKIEGEGGEAAGGDPLDEATILGDAEGAKPEGESEGGEGEGKEGDDAAGPLVGDVPETYTIAAPEGTVLDETAMGIFDPVFRKLGLTDAGAQELVNAAPALIDHIAGQAAQQQMDAIVNTRKEWAQAAMADPEIGGKNLERSKQLAASVFDRYGLKADGPFRTILNDSGLANHPDMIRVFAKIGADMAEDSFPVGDGTPAKDQSRLERMYPNDTPKAK
jgi:hypothetical protein